MGNKLNKALDEEVKIRVTKSEKDNLKLLASEAGISMSELIRQALYGERKIIFLSEGKDIAKELFLIRSDLDKLIKNGGFPKEAVEPLMNAINELSERLFEVTEKLTDIHSSQGGDTDVGL